jgi:hypothetical protein
LGSEEVVVLEKGQGKEEVIVEEKYLPPAITVIEPQKKEEEKGEDEGERGVERSEGSRDE